MAEVITEISEYHGRHPDLDNEGNQIENWSTSEEGIEIVTTDQTITLAIDDQSSCCESWGYFLTEDDWSKFIGAELRGISLTDTNRYKKTFNDPKAAWDDDGNIDTDAGGVMFVDLETDRGTLQFVAYNAHNGYYGHAARVSSKQLAHSETL